MDNEVKHDALILIADDEQGAREALEVILEDRYRILSASNGKEVLDALKKHSIDLVLLDINMPDIDGMEVLERARQLDEDVDIIMVSALDSATKAVESLKLGACDYITKPFEPDDILISVDRVMDRRRLKREAEYLKKELASHYGDWDIVTRDKKMLEILELVKKVANTASNILICGESGTGKELIALAIHKNGDRGKAPFVAINCGAIPSELIESELFGHEKGAFTGAIKKRLGKFEFADGGTIFLDEVATLPPLLQVKLLRVIQERQIERVGSNLSIKVDVRVIAATNKNLKGEVEKGRFRSDLYYRLNVVPIHLPPLRDRSEDIPLLAQHFLKKFNKSLNKKVKGFTPDVLQILMSYPWYGNVRELENFVERMVVLSENGELITLKKLPVEIFTVDMLHHSSSGDKASLREACRIFEKQFIVECLKREGWNQTKTARLLNIHRNTLVIKLKELGIRFDPLLGKPSRKTSPLIGD